MNRHATNNSVAQEKKSRREKVPIALNNVLNFYRKISSDLKHKGNLVSLQVHISHFGIGANPKQAGASFGKKTAQKLNCTKNNPLSVIVTLLAIYREVIPSIIDLVPITQWELFKTMCMGTSVAEFNGILFKASGRTFKFIQEDFNKKICLADENSEEVKAWKEKNDKGKL